MNFRDLRLRPGKEWNNFSLRDLYLNVSNRLNFAQTGHKIHFRDPITISRLANKTSPLSPPLEIPNPLSHRNVF
jgi:hypothetical protein